MTISPTIEQIQQALTLAPFDALRAWRRMAPIERGFERPPERSDTAKQAGVLILLYPYEQSLSFALTVRSPELNSHAGQVSLPGGSIEPADQGSTEAAALRETCEEIGVCTDAIQILGKLTSLYIDVSDFEMHPYVGFLQQRPSFALDTIEVASLLEVPLSNLFEPELKKKEKWSLQGMRLNVPFYAFAGEAVWGATAIVLSEFEHRLRVIVGNVNV